MSSCLGSASLMPLISSSIPSYMCMPFHSHVPTAPAVGATTQARRAGEEGEEGYMKLAAEEAELNRARERLTLRHKNTSRWARRALKRGINLMDAGVGGWGVQGQGVAQRQADQLLMCMCG